MLSAKLNILVTILVLVILLLLFQDTATQNSLVYYLGLAQNPSEVKAIKKDPNQIESSIVNRVIDGDTIVLEDGRIIRYLNMDTPETKKPNTIVQCYGPEASSFNKSLVEGKKVTLISDKQDEDRYGRDLRIVFLEGRNTQNIEDSVNAQMVKNGYARSLIIKPNNTYENLFNKLEAEAKKQNVGLWGSCTKPFTE